MIENIACDSTFASFYIVQEHERKIMTANVHSRKPSSRDLLSPPAELCPAYFWYLNGPMEPAVLRRQLREMAAQGVRNVCPHPWPHGFRPNRHPSFMTPVSRLAQEATVPWRIEEWDGK